jgi:hypothetical protein
MLKASYLAYFLHLMEHLLLSSSSSSPLCRVFIHTIPRQTMSLGNTLLQLFCRYCLWCLYLQFLRWLFCTFTLALSEVCVQCPIWLFSVVPQLHGFLVCCSRIFLMILKWFIGLLLLLSLLLLLLLPSQEPSTCPCPDQDQSRLPPIHLCWF